MTNTDFPDWVRLEILILRRTCTVLRKLFCQRWKSSENSDWSNCPEFGHRFINGLGSHIYRNCGYLHRLILEEGNINNWDFNILIRILLEAEFKVPSNLQNENPMVEENQKLEQLKSYCIKATLYHHKSMNDEEFCQYWNSIAKILVCLGDSEKQLEELKSCLTTCEDSFMFNSSVTDFNDQHTMNANNALVQVRQLQDQAKSAFDSCNNDKMDELLQKLTMAISHDDLPEKELCVLLTTRSEVYLKAAIISENKLQQKKTTYLALKDAKRALLLKPAWYLARYRVGQAYLELGKFKKAAGFLDQALELEPNMNEIKNDRKMCDFRLIELERASSSGLGSSRGTTPEGLDDVESSSPTSPVFPAGLPTLRPGGTCLSPNVQSSMDKILFFNWDDRSNILAVVHHANKLRDGFKGNCREAAQLYKECAKHHNAEAMYNLALLKLYGQGTKHDPIGAISLLKKTAKQPYYNVCKEPVSSFVSNVGVAESEFLLGLLNDMGYGFPQKDAFSAAHWYQDANDHGSGHAAHNLAILYYRGQGVVKNEEKAIQLWKLGAARGVVHSMISLAIYHLKNWQTEQVRYWLSTAYAVSPHNMIYCDFPLSHKEHEEMRSQIDQIDIWRRMYTIRVINKWEIEVGLCSTRINNTFANNASSSANLKPRLIRMLRRLEYEKEKVKMVEEYLSSIKPKPVIFNFPKDNSSGKSKNRVTSTTSCEKACESTADDMSDTRSIESNTCGDSGLEN